MKKYNIPIENVIRHFDVTGKSCPAYYVDNTAWEALKNRIQKTTVVSSPTITVQKTLYRVRKSWSDAASQTGAYSSLDNAKKNCKKGYSVFDEAGNVVYSNAAKEDTSGKKYYRVQTGSYSLQKNAVAM